VLPILISVPHGGTETPNEISGRVIASPHEIFDDSDARTRDIYAFYGEVVHFASAKVARAFVDLNRAPDDRPPANPDGVVKSETCYGRPIYDPVRHLTDTHIEQLLQRYYYPYHRALEEASPDPGQKRPLFCLSNDSGRTSPIATIERLADALAAAFEIDRSDIWLNRPFKGGYITRSHSGGGVPWIQLEMNRSLYLADPWFDRENLHVDAGRLRDLRDRVLEALSLMTV
jgi:formiminoglutamase